MICTILGDVYGITVRLDVGTYLVSFDGSFDGSTDDKLEGLLIGGSFVYTDGKVIVSDEGIKLGISDGKVIVTIIGDVDGIILGFDVETWLNSLDRSLTGSNDGELE